jgi:glutathione S-transferase
MPDLPAAQPIEVHALPAIWGSPSPSPFAIKLLTWLRMAGVPHVLRPLRGPPRSATGKIPYVVLADGRTLHDSGLVIATLASERGIDLDSGLDPAARATGHALRRMLEEHTYWAGLYDRWIADAGFPHTARDYFAHLPAVARAILPRMLRRRMRAYLHAQGTGRHPPEVIAASAQADLAALSDVLADRAHVLGPLSTVDATAVGFLWAFQANPFPSAVGSALTEHENLVAYLARMRARWWPEGPG